MESLFDAIIFSMDLSLFCHRPVLSVAQHTSVLLGMQPAPTLFLVALAPKQP